MNNDIMSDVRLPLDERNLAHVLSAIALFVLGTRTPRANSKTATCWWDERDFVLRAPMNEATLIDTADRFIRDIRWIPGFGGAEQGSFVAGHEIGSNPFISLADDGQETSPLKTFSGQVSPGKDLLDKQRESLKRATTVESWISQTSRNISSWGLDCRVGSHAYDLGFSSNDEGSGILDPIYPAIELLSIAAASFFVAVQGWQSDKSTIRYSVWTQPISVSMVSFAVAGRLDGLPTRQYRVTNRGTAYGKGAAYRFFPEATLQS